MSARASHSYGELSRDLLALLQDLVQDRRSSSADVQRIDRSAQRQRDQLVASLRDAWTQSGALAAEHERYAGAGVVGLVVGDRARVITARAVAPAACTARVSEEISDVAYTRDTQMLDGAGRRLTGRRRDLGCTALGNDDAGGADALGRAADRAKVLRVLDLVEHDDQRLP